MASCSRERRQNQPNPVGLGYFNKPKAKLAYIETDMRTRHENNCRIQRQN